MIALLLISTIAIISALLRAKRDSLLSHGTGKWKTYAFLEGLYESILSVLMVKWALGIPWGESVLLALVYAFIWSLFFDCIQGFIRTGNILHIGTVGFDAKVRATVKGRLWLWPFAKIFWLIVLIGGYLSF